MTAPSLVPTARSSDLATFTIKVGGNAIASTFHVLAITIVREVNRVPLARVVLLDGDPASSEFASSDAPEFVPGSELEISMGYHGEELPVFVGVVVGHSIRAREGRSSTLEIECRDKASAMTVGRRSVLRTQVTDQEVIEELARGHGLAVDAESTAVTHDELVQFRVSDWDFMLSRADAVGQVVSVVDGEVRSFVPVVSGEPALILHYGSSIVEFEASLDARQQVVEATATAWDAGSQAPVEITGADPGLEEAGNIAATDLAQVVGHTVRRAHVGALADDELQAWADASLLRSRLAKIRGRVRCQGFAEIEPGATLELSGVGERFTGRVFVSAVRHQFVGQDWLTDLQFGLDPEGHHTKDCVREAPAAGLVPSVAGLEIGVVSQLQDDPGVGERVLVNLPMIDPDGDGIWARLGIGYAGESYGMCFRPEIGDEVVLGFLNGDPRDPVILGSLHSAARPAPYEAQDDNHEKGLVTKGELKLELHDGDKVIRITTPGGNEIVLSEADSAITIKDQNGNTIELAGSGITVESAGDLTLKASGTVSIEGSSIEAKADAEFKAEGSAGAELKSGGSTVVKGSMVQIN